MGGGLVNLSPYDGWLEKTALRWEQTHPGQTTSSLSLSGDVNVSGYCEWQAAFYILQERVFTSKS